MRSTQLQHLHSKYPSSVILGFKFETHLLLTKKRETTNQMTKSTTDSFLPSKHGRTRSSCFHWQASKSSAFGALNWPLSYSSDGQHMQIAQTSTNADIIEQFEHGTGIKTDVQINETEWRARNKPTPIGSILWQKRQKHRMG